MKNIKQLTTKESYSLMLYGMPKTGLTELGCQAPSPVLFLNLKDNTSNHECTKISVSNWYDFLSSCNEIAQGKYEQSTIVLAHVEDLWEYLCNHITEKYNLENGTSAQNISELSFGDWRRALNIFEDKLKKFLTLGNVILLSHEMSESRNVRGLERTYFLANIERKAQLIVLNLVDAIGRLYAAEQDIRVLSFIPRENQITGSRISKLLDKKYVIMNGEKPEFYKHLESEITSRRRVS